MGPEEVFGQLSVSVERPGMRQSVGWWVPLAAWRGGDTPDVLSPRFMSANWPGKYVCSIFICIVLSWLFLAGSLVLFFFVLIMFVLFVCFGVFFLL